MFKRLLTYVSKRKGLMDVVSQLLMLGSRDIIFRIHPLTRLRDSVKFSIMLSNWKSSGAGAKASDGIFYPKDSSLDHNARDGDSQALSKPRNTLGGCMRLFASVR